MTAILDSDPDIDEAYRRVRTRPVEPPPTEGDDTISCDGCPETFRRREMRDRAGWTLCPDCASDHDQATDKRLTRELAHTH